MSKRQKIAGTETIDHPEGMITTHAGALRFARRNMPADLKRAGFVATVCDSMHGPWWRINYGKTF